MFSPLLRSILPAFGLFALLAIPTAILTSADNDPVVKNETVVDTCPVCSKSMKEIADRKSMTIDGRTMHCCSDKCGEAMKANKEYYKGFHDGAERKANGHIGPKGGETRKGIPPQN